MWAKPRQQPIDPAGDVDLKTLLAVGARCTTAQLHAPSEDGQAWTVVGRSDGGALLVAVRKAWLDGVDTLGETVHEIPFDSDRKAMSVVIAAEGRQRMLTKGAPK